MIEWQVSRTAASSRFARLPRILVFIRRTFTFLRSLKGPPFKVELKARSPRGELLSAFAGMRKNAEVFIDVLGLNQIDLLGFSVGGIVAQQTVVDRSEPMIDNVVVPFENHYRKASQGSMVLESGFERIKGENSQKCRPRISFCFSDGLFGMVPEWGYGPDRQ
jgi:hypothetical protein